MRTVLTLLTAVAGLSAMGLWMGFMKLLLGWSSQSENVFVSFLSGAAFLSALLGLIALALAVVFITVEVAAKEDLSGRTKRWLR